MWSCKAMVGGGAADVPGDGNGFGNGSRHGVASWVL